jgi:hypothetical protein
MGSGDKEDKEDKADKAERFVPTAHKKILPLFPLPKPKLLLPCSFSV